MQLPKSGVPVRPEEIAAAKGAALPPQVIDVFNRHIAIKFNGGSAVVEQDALIRDLCAALNIERSEVFARNYLDVEPIFEQAGWTVTYDKPAYNESYPATFTFRAGA